MVGPSSAIQPQAATFQCEKRFLWMAVKTAQSRDPLSYPRVIRVEGLFNAVRANAIAIPADSPFSCRRQRRATLLFFQLVDSCHLLRKCCRSFASFIWASIFHLTVGFVCMRRLLWFMSSLLTFSWHTHNTALPWPLWHPQLVLFVLAVLFVDFRLEALAMDHRRLCLHIATEVCSCLCGSHPDCSSSAGALYCC